ncbi:hypothetical protein TNCV_4868671 [Trichonephila clavipes]|nr:hypothetical protein TNCV_4868671 [Trichonephila clavipes]
MWRSSDNYERDEKLFLNVTQHVNNVSDFILMGDIVRSHCAKLLDEYLRQRYSTFSQPSACGSPNLSKWPGDGQLQ